VHCAVRLTYTRLKLLLLILKAKLGYLPSKV
jgi:hypothetical protein